MALISRMTRLFTADVNAVLDRLEEPEVLLQQAIREMEAELITGEQRLRAMTADGRRLATREAELRGLLQDIEDELDICFSRCEETLARSVVRKKLVASERLRNLTNETLAVNEATAELGKACDARRTELRDLQARAETFEGTWQGSASDGSELDRSIGNEDVDVAFLREKMLREDRQGSKER